jgi:hypothetical protein
MEKTGTPETKKARRWWLRIIPETLKITLNILILPPLTPTLVEY